VAAEMKVSLLISTFNGKGYISPLLESIEKLFLGNHDLEVILRDDNSTDGTAGEVSRNFPFVHLIKGDLTLGFSKSNNIAFGDAIICCINQDTILDPHFLLEALSILEDRPEVAGINTNMIMPWVLSFEEFAKTPLEQIPSYEYQLTLYGFTKYIPVGSVVRETNFLTGGGFFLQRSALGDREELFDSNITMYCEDTDLSLRLRKKGMRFAYAPKVVLYHNQDKKQAGSIRELKKLMGITWNRFYVLSKHRPPLYFLISYPLYIWGIVAKMGYLGLPLSRTLFAYFVGACLAIPFFGLLPYWLWRSSRFAGQH